MTANSEMLNGDGVSPLKPGDFDVALERVDDQYHLRLSGELDLATAPWLRDHLVEIAADGPGHVVVDLSRLAFIDSTGLSVLVGGWKRLRESGGDLVLRSPSPAVAKVLDIAGLHEVFPIS